MLTIKTDESRKVGKVTFSLTGIDTERQVSLLGDFNEWDPLANPLEQDEDGVQRASVELPLGASYQFKYLTDDGTWFCDPDVEEREPNEYGELNSVVQLA